MLILSDYDHARLCRLVERLRESSARERVSLRDLEDKLERAIVVRPEQVPRGVVTMYSTVQFTNLATGTGHVCSLVFPDETSLESKKISVLAPIGTALLGEVAGSTVDCWTPDGVKKLHIDSLLFQPEAAGFYYV